MDGLPGMVERHWVYDHLTVKVISMKKYLFLLPVLLALAACGAQPALTRNVTLIASAQIESQPTSTLTPPVDAGVAALRREQVWR